MGRPDKRDDDGSDKITDDGTQAIQNKPSLLPAGSLRSALGPTRLEIYKAAMLANVRAQASRF
jgi:hypothetical protein